MFASKLLRLGMGLAWVVAFLLGQPGLSSLAAAPAAQHSASDLSLAARPPAWPALGGNALWDGRFALGTDAWVAAVAFAPNGDIYIGGSFTQVAGLGASHVARW